MITHLINSYSSMNFILDVMINSTSYMIRIGVSSYLPYLKYVIDSWKLENYIWKVG